MSTFVYWRSKVSLRCLFFFSSRRRHTRSTRDWSSDVCSSDLKTLRETALYFSGLRQRGLYGIDYSLKEGLTISDFMFRERIVVENEWKIIRRNLERHNIRLVQGEASFKDAHTIMVGGPDGKQTGMASEIVLIATGSSPHHPANVPFDHRMIYDSDSILHMDRIPQSMAIIGGGVIGSEYAGIFTALGVRVTLVDMRDR